MVCIGVHVCALLSIGASILNRIFSCSLCHYEVLHFAPMKNAIITRAVRKQAKPATLVCFVLKIICYDCKHRSEHVVTSLDKSRA